MKAQEAFRQDPKVQLPLATDSAGEGINLQRAHLVNYDLPWNPNRLEQRFRRKVAARLPDGRFHPRYARLRARVEAEFGNQKLVEITHEDLRALTDAIVERGAPATAVHARGVVLQVYRWAIGDQKSRTRQS